MLKFIEIKVPKKLNKCVSRSAYTLIELSIVISIIAVLMTGAIGISVSFINTSKKNSSITRVNTIYSAVGKFILANKRLPCPASLNLSNNDPMFGVERSSNAGGCSSSAQLGVFSSGNIYYGMVPVKTLGLSLEMAKDDFGSKISYIIDARFSGLFQEVPDFAKASFGTIEDLTSMIVSENLLSVSRAINNEAILVIISHGLNKFGAYNFNSTTQNSLATDADEASNQPSATFDTTFVQSSQNSTVFDDILLFKTRNQIVDDFSLHYIVACKADATFTNSVYYGQTVYSTPCSTTYKRIPEAYCDRFGKLLVMNKCP